MVKSRLIIFSFISVVISLVSLFYFDLLLTQYFHENQRNLNWVIFDHLTEIGERSYWIIISGILYFMYRYFPHLDFFPRWVCRDKERCKRATGFVALSALFSGLVVNIFKLIFARYRPVEYFEHDYFGFTWFDHGYRIASFPSGHSATALGLAVALTILFPRFKYPIFIMGLLIMFSRVVLVEHYFSDVVMGGFVGVMSVLYLYQKYYRLVF